MITPGLAGTVEAHIMDVISRCGPVCTLRVEARGADTGESKACKFIMGCADVLRPDKASAVAAENACREQHRQAAAEVGGWINQTAADMATATVELANIEAAMAAVNAHLDELL
jgi:hypothetical protein